jgi:hypothetical protein
VGGQGDQRPGQAERADPQIARRQLGRLARAAHHAHERVREDDARGDEHRGDGQRQPEGLRRHLARAVLLPGAVQPRHLRGRAVDEEVAQADDGAEHRRRECQRGQLARPEMADDRRVGEQVQRLGSERAEGRQRQPYDLAVVTRSAHAATIRWAR